MRYRLRNAEPKDLPRIWRMADAQNRRDSTNYPFPEVFEMDESKAGFGKLLPNIPLALVTERDGRAVKCNIFLRTIEAMSFGGGREDMEFDAAHIPIALDLLRRRGYEEVHTFIPRVRVSPQHCKLLETYGMTRLDNRLAHFFRTT